MRAPTSLSKASQRIWRAIDGEWQLDTSGLLLLRTALEAYDRYTEAREAVSRDGMTYTTESGYMRPHPLLQVEKESRAAFLGAWRSLGLDIEPPGEVGRPPDVKEIQFADR